MEIKEKKLKLYVWEEVFTDYTNGLAFALAYTKKQAAELVSKQMDSEKDPHSFYFRELMESKPRIFQPTHPIGFGVYGGG